MARTSIRQVLGLVIPRPHKVTDCPQIAISTREHSALRERPERADAH
jgi:hypothetical protein